jgi:indolepyruvate decarboxylase
MSEADTIPLNVAGGQSAEGLSIGHYLVQRLQDYGLRDLFGIPGDYVLSFYSLLERSPINVIGCTREDSAGMAADAYARVNGLGAVCVTYCVGGLSLCNSIAGAYAEKSPVVVISGSPGLQERVNDPLLHHKVRDFRTQMEVFEKLCVAGTELSDPVFAFREIDRVLDAATRYKRPVYIELPRDMVKVIPQIGQAYQQIPQEASAQAAEEAANEAARMLSAAKRPLILAGVEIHRFGLQDKLLELAEMMQVPIAATLLGKSVIRETHPQFIGLYEGAMGHDEVTRYVEESDCILLLGTFMTDINLGIFTANLDPNRCIYVTSEQLRIRHHHYHAVTLANFIDRLIERRPVPTQREIPAMPQPLDETYEIEPESPITVPRMVARLNEAIDENTMVIADIGDSLFAGTELCIRGRNEFLGSAYYASMGFSVPAALGAMTARPDLRALVLCGDGAFQMTGMEISTIVRHNLAAIILVLDNEGYGTERVLHKGDWEYNNVNPWQYHKLPEIVGGGTGYLVETEAEFDDAIKKAWADTSAMSLIHVKLSKDTHSETLARLAERLSKKV